MRSCNFWVGLTFVVLSSSAATGCGAQVTVEREGSGGGGDVTVAVGAAGGSSPSGCAGSPDFCADDCGSDYFPYEEDCVDGRWQCPAGTVNPNDCPAGTCWGGPLACETCGPAGWACEPTTECVGSCSGMVCAACPEAPGPTLLGACSCACDDAGNFSCDLAEGCCNDDADCGDESYAPCVENVCKEPVAGACWKDSECLDGDVCEGASVCPCGFDCDAPDVPGTCVPA